MRKGNLAWFLLSLFSSLLGCQRKELKVEKVVKIEGLPLYRGIMSGLSVKEVEEEICRRLSFIRCHRLRMSDESTKRRKVYSYSLEDFSHFCSLKFIFRDWGLSEIFGFCRILRKRDRENFLKKYFRKYDFSFVETRKGERIFLGARGNNVSIELRERGDGIWFHHEDRRRQHLLEIAKIRPKRMELSEDQWRLWKEVPPKVRKRVLFNFATLILRMKEFRKRYPKKLLRSEQAWTPEFLGHRCLATVVQKEYWREEPWKSLNFHPLSPRFLHYRVRFLQRGYGELPKELSHRYSWLISRRRTLLIEAKGCGYQFTLRGKPMKRGIDFAALRIERSRF